MPEVILCRRTYNPLISLFIDGAGSTRLKTYCTAGLEAWEREIHEAGVFSSGVTTGVAGCVTSHVLVTQEALPFKILR